MTARPAWLPNGAEIEDAFGDTLFPSDYKIIDSLITTAVEKALAEQREVWIAALKAANGECKCHPDFAEMWAKAEASPDYWAELLSMSANAYRKLDAERSADAATTGDGK